jgi:phosphatidylserine decarboxylase
MCIGVAPPSKAPWPHPFIAREGWPILAMATVAALVTTWLLGWLWAMPVWGIAFMVLQFFRDPPRHAPIGEGLVLSPADGRIVAVEEMDDPWLNRRALKVSVFMNMFNVHSSRSPVDGEVKGCGFNPGQSVNADLDQSSTDKERNALWFRTKEGQDVTCVQVAGLIARRILCYVEQGAQMHRGERYGFIRFGSRMDVYLPLQAKLRVALGDKVSASRDVLAQL